MALNLGTAAIDDSRATGFVKVIELTEQQQHVHFSNYIFLLRECSKTGSLIEGKRVQDYIVKAGHKENRFLANLLIQMYGKCPMGLKDARAVFDEITEPNIFSWTAIISAYASQRQYREALDLFRLMDLEGIKPDKFVFNIVLSVCSRLGEIRLGKQVHSRVTSEGLDSNDFIRNSLVSMYGKCGCLEEAKHLFEKLSSRNPVCWNSLLTAYTQNGHSREALSILQCMDLKGVKPNTVTFVLLLEAYSSLRVVWDGICDRILASGLHGDVSISNSLVNMFGKCGNVKKARDVFEGMSFKDVVSWNTMLGAYAQNGYSSEALDLFRRMDLLGVEASRVTYIIILEACSGGGGWDYTGLCSRICTVGLGCDFAIANSMIFMHAKRGNFVEAMQVFHRMDDHRDVISWNIMISASAQNGLPEEACKLFRKMDLEGVKPDVTTLTSVLDACNDKNLGKQLHSRVSSTGMKLDVMLETSLLGMYARCSEDMQDARKVFEAAAVNKDRVLWNAMVAAYAQAGHPSEALELHRKMDLEGHYSDEVTFSNLLTVCALSPEMLEKGREIELRAISSVPSNTVLLTAVLNFRGKCGDLVGARHAFEGLSERDVVAWTAMVAAYAQKGYSMDALEFFRCMEQEGVNPNQITMVHVLFACSHAGMMEEGRFYFVSMNERDIVPMQDHYLCIVDLLSRLGKLGYARELVECMPFHADYVAWMTVLGNAKDVMDGTPG